MSIPNRFIVVDDDPTSNMICRFSLQGLSTEAEIDIFTEPENVLAIIERTYGGPTECPPAVLFLDLNMPSMTGWEFMGELGGMDRRVREQLTIYILSSSLDKGDMERAGEHPLVKGFISKPLTLEILRQEFGHG
ncbi:response regulator [Rufibacter tibetensis]|uniref:Response regulatory domain-containing protein n=1 Tax=Rufibacter tibetensis TaxID=512763 RepID=A0A0P0C5H5_9BACT|nr:response regulator [Rufibacter tibetensis]ALJ00194.1 hypothetical protein DC20_16010 [Rufibacter tibetensis]